MSFALYISDSHRKACGLPEMTGQQSRQMPDSLADLKLTDAMM